MPATCTLSAFPIQHIRHAMHIFSVPYTTELVWLSPQQFDVSRRGKKGVQPSRDKKCTYRSGRGGSACYYMWSRIWATCTRLGRRNKGEDNKEDKTKNKKKKKKRIITDNKGCAGCRWAERKERTCAYSYTRQELNESTKIQQSLTTAVCVLHIKPFSFYPSTPSTPRVQHAILHPKEMQAL